MITTFTSRLDQCTYANGGPKDRRRFNCASIHSCVLRCIVVIIGFAPSVVGVLAKICQQSAYNRRKRFTIKSYSGLRSMWVGSEVMNHPERNCLLPNEKRKTNLAKTKQKKLGSQENDSSAKSIAIHPQTCRRVKNWRLSLDISGHLFCSDFEVPPPPHTLT